MTFTTLVVVVLLLSFFNVLPEAPAGCCSAAAFHRADDGPWFDRDQRLVVLFCPGGWSMDFTGGKLLVGAWVAPALVSVTNFVMSPGVTCTRTAPSDDQKR